MIQKSQAVKRPAPSATAMVNIMSERVISPESMNSIDSGLRLAHPIKRAIDTPIETSVKIWGHSRANCVSSSIV